MSKLFSFFKTAKPKQFNYRPIYYNPEEEKNAQRNTVEKPAETKIYKHDRAGFQNKIHDRWQRKNGKANPSKSANIRVIIILVFLGLIAWWLMH